MQVRQFSAILTVAFLSVTLASCSNGPDQSDATDIVHSAATQAKDGEDPDPSTFMIDEVYDSDGYHLCGGKDDGPCTRLIAEWSADSTTVQGLAKGEKSSLNLKSDGEGAFPLVTGDHAETHVAKIKDKWYIVLDYDKSSKHITEADSADYWTPYTDEFDYSGGLAK